MNGPDATEYLNAIKLEIQTLKNQNTWATVDCPKDKSVLKSNGHSNSNAFQMA